MQRLLNLLSREKEEPRALLEQRGAYGSDAADSASVGHYRDISTSMLTAACGAVLHHALPRGRNPSLPACRRSEPGSAPDDEDARRTSA
jgi:hypothetical protein